MSSDRSGSDSEYETVYVRGTAQGGRQLILHTNRDCVRLSSASNVYSRSREAYPNDEKICEWCSGSVDQSGGGNSGLWQDLEDADPGDFVTDGGVDQPGSEHECPDCGEPLTVLYTRNEFDPTLVTGWCEGDCIGARCVPIEEDEDPEIATDGGEPQETGTDHSETLVDRDGNERPASIEINGSPFHVDRQNPNLSASFTIYINVEEPRGDTPQHEFQRVVQPGGRSALTNGYIEEQIQSWEEHHPEFTVSGFYIEETRSARIGRRLQPAEEETKLMTDGGTDQTGTERIPPLNLTDEEADCLWEMIKRDIGKEEVWDGDETETVRSLHTKIGEVNSAFDDEDDKPELVTDGGEPGVECSYKPCGNRGEVLADVVGGGGVSVLLCESCAEDGNESELEYENARQVNVEVQP